MKVIKLGGSLLDDAQTRASVLQTIAASWNSGHEVVLVHGGGKHIDAMLAKLGIGKKTHAGLRITDAKTLDVVVSVLGGSVNKMLVGELTKLRVKAAGISGSDAGTVVAEQHPPIDGVDLGHVGRVVSSNPMLVKAMLLYGMLPVVSSIAMSTDGKLFNVNADSAAAALAASLKAESLQFLTDVDGVLDIYGNVLEQMTAEDANALVLDGVIKGGMLPKMSSALGAITAGVGSVTIGRTTIVSPAVSTRSPRILESSQPGATHAAS